MSQINEAGGDHGDGVCIGGKHLRNQLNPHTQNHDQHRTHPRPTSPVAGGWAPDKRPQKPSYNLKELAISGELAPKVKFIPGDMFRWIPGDMY